MEQIETFFNENQWESAGILGTPARGCQLFGIEDLSLSPSCNKYLKTLFPQGIYRHQKEGIRFALADENICLSTGTASGKSLVFYAVAMEYLQRDPTVRVIAIYPMKALGAEQEIHWRDAFQAAGLDIKVGRIDGSVRPMSRRTQILRECRVVVCTPDIIHAWFLSNLNDPQVRSFLRNLSLIVVDEVHSYSGVFGSNAAFLFRRIQHLMNLWEIEPHYVCASATISKPKEHLHKLFGVEFRLITSELDTSPRYELKIYLVTPPGLKDFITNIVQLLAYLSMNTKSRFIAFVDSRKQVELLSSILARSHDKKPQESEIEQQDDLEENDKNEKAFDSEILDRLQVLPYRAGYEEIDRRRIQERLIKGALCGVVSTSALELGIDIHDLDVCILVGVPNSATSLYQRIGRVGRNTPATVIVVNSGDVLDQAVFSNPESLLRRPLAESALYLENQYIQYIHALCLARFNGEHDQVIPAHTIENSDGFVSSVDWPINFLDLCRQEREGQISRTLQSMKIQAGESPNHEFPLRDVESQFKVEFKQGLDILDTLGSLSYSQVMREAYPGAVYYYATQPYRVLYVKPRAKQVIVKRTRYYTTRPIFLPTQVFPNLTNENVYVARQHEKLIIVECDLQVREAICGVCERRGPNEHVQNYPLNGELGVSYDQNFFVRNYFTTGVVVSHPCLCQPGVELSTLAALIFEAFLITIPFERQDINFADDKYRSARPPLICQGDRFLAIYDQTYGSLRLTNRIMDESVFNQVLELVRELAVNQEITPVGGATLAAIDTLIFASQQAAIELFFEVDKSSGSTRDSTLIKRVIIPGSKGLSLNLNNEEFQVKRVFLTPDGLRYEGISQSLVPQEKTVSCYPLVSEIAEIPGISEIGYYDYQTGEIKIETTSIRVIQEEKVQQKPEPVKQVDLGKLEVVLNSHFSESALELLCQRMSLRYNDLLGDKKAEKVRALIGVCVNREIEIQLLMSAFQLKKEGID